MIKPDIATELERVNEKLADYMTEDHNVVIDKLDLLIKMVKNQQLQSADKEKLEAIIEVIEKLDKLCNTKINDYNRSPEVEDFENAIYDMRKILGILWKD